MHVNGVNHVQENDVVADGIEESFVGDLILTVVGIVIVNVEESSAILISFVLLYISTLNV